MDHVAEKLSLIDYANASYHGDLSPTAREKALNSFKNKAVNILILTDIPNDITDFPNIGLVLFLSIPQDADTYIQRIIRLESTLDITKVATLISTSEFKKIAFIKRVTKTTIIPCDFKPIQALIDIKKQQLVTALETTDPSDIPPDVQSLSHDLLTKFSPDQVVSFLLHRGFHGCFSSDSYKSLLAPNSSNAPLPSNDTDSSDSERLFIAIGRADKIKEADLRSFLVSETNIPQDAYSDIKIFDTFSFFVVSKENADIILEIFRRKKRGKRSIVERAKGKDAKKK